MKDDQIVWLDLELIDPPADAARDIIDPDKVRELADTIRSQGLLQPIVVRPHNGRFEVVIGHRRYLAHRLIGEVKIKTFVRDLTDEEVDVIRFVENDQREDLNSIERAKGYARMRDRHSMTLNQIGAKVGKSHQTVMRYLRLLEMSEEFRDAVARGILAMETALTLYEIDDPQFRQYYFVAAVRNGATVETAKFWVSEYQRTKAGKSPDSGGGEGEPGPLQQVLPVYQTCHCCIGPVPSSSVSYVPLCPDCVQRVRGALKPDQKQ